MARRFMSKFRIFALLTISLSALAAIAQTPPATAQTAPANPLTSAPVLPLYRALRTVGLDPKNVFKIREAELDREDLHVWLNDGTIAFTKSVDGHITGAYFEGEGEVLVRPPDRRERASLGRFIGAGVLEEKIASAYLRFNDDTVKELEPYLRAPEDAAAFVAANNNKAVTLAQMDALRLCISLTSGPASSLPGENPPLPDRLLHVRVVGEQYGVFDIYFDTRSPEQVVVGKLSSQQDQIFYDLWMSFPMRSLRKAPLSDSRFGGPTGPLWTPDVMSISKYTINARFDPPHELAADATLEAKVKQGGTRIVLFELSRYLQVKQVMFEGKPLEFLQNEAIQGSEMSRRGNDIVAVIFPAPLESGAQLSMKFTYAGPVLSDAGGGLFYVGARGTWYPNRGMAMADYDLTFRFPRPFSLVATGKRVSLTRENDDTFVGRWVSERPIPIAGFNLGEYVHSAANAANVSVEAYAAIGSENQIAPSGSAQVSPPEESLLASRSATPAGAAITDPAVAGQELADHAAQTLTSLEQLLGPYPFSTLSLTERPGADSQGWPTLIFLSRYAYLDAEHLMSLNLPPSDQIIYSEVMMPHELVHQWFGDDVSWASYHEQWLLEALANYTSLLLLERTRPADVQITLEAYRSLLAAKSREGNPNVDAGPVTLGVRLSSSHYPDGYEIITYARGTWLLHMLRNMLRDAARTPENPEGDDTVFLGLLRSLVDRYQGKQITNDDFESAVEAVLPRSLWFENRQSLDWFFDGWVNGTAFPQFELEGVKIARGVGHGTASGVLRQLNSPPDLVSSLPIYGDAGDHKVYLGRLFAEGDETHFSLPVPAEVKKLEVDPYHTVLTAPR